MGSASILLRCTERGCYDCAAVPIAVLQRPFAELRASIRAAGWSIEKARPTTSPIMLVGNEPTFYAIRCPMHTAAIGVRGRANGAINI